MQYGKVAGVGKRVSRLVQGTMMLSSEALEASFALLDAVLAAGGNAFDLAHVYGGGDAERVFGQWMQSRGNREQVVVITKGAHFNADRNRVTPFDIASDLHDSLARLKTDYVDLYLLHRDDPQVPVGPIVEVLDNHVRAGRIRAFGGSNWTHERIAEANAHADAHDLIGFAASSPQFSLVAQVEPPWPGCVSIGGPEGASARDWYAAHQMPVFGWSSLGRSFLSGQLTRSEIEALPHEEEETWLRTFRSAANLDRLDRAAELAARKGATVPQIALAYLLHQPLNLYPLIGCHSGDEFRVNSAALDISLAPEEVQWLDLQR